MRMTTEARGAALILGLGMLLAAPGAGLAQGSGRAPVHTTPRFAFYSDFDTNLNDALIAAGLARKKNKPEQFHAGADPSGTEASCFGELPPSARAGWDGAVAYYAEIVSPASWTDRQQFLLRVDLAGFDEEVSDPEARQFVDIARGFRAAATPAYAACRWPAQDAANRRWIQALGTRLAADEEKIATRLEALYAKRWSGLPIPVDVVETVDWSGANSILRDLGGGHLLVSAPSYPGPSALEVVFHEASHLLMGYGAPVRQALDGAAGSAEIRLPGDLWHVVLFYTTGEVMRRAIDEGGEPGYTPMLYEIFERSESWGRYREALESAWRPYVEGKGTLAEAAARLIEAVRKAAPPQPGGTR